MSSEAHSKVLERCRHKIKESTAPPKKKIEEEFTMEIHTRVRKSEENVENPLQISRSPFVLFLNLRKNVFLSSFFYSSLLSAASTEKTHKLQLRVSRFLLLFSFLPKKFSESLEKAKLTCSPKCQMCFSFTKANKIITEINTRGTLDFLIIKVQAYLVVLVSVKKRSFALEST